MIQFWSKVLINEENPDGCWVWQGSLTRGGYGRFSDVRAHRTSFIECGGVLTSEKPMVLHKCNNPPCVNPNHLYAGDVSDNCKDAKNAGTFRNNGAEINKAKQSCLKGHEYNKENTGFTKKNQRWCRKCSRNRNKVRRVNVHSS